MENREIKFRAWDKENKIMIDHFYLFDDIFTSNGQLAMYSRKEDWVIMQYTGLNDRNGVEIYEGDILNFDIQDHNGNDNIYTLPVEYYVDTFMCFDKDTDAYFSIGEIKANDEELEVIGNIYENPELLTNKN